jgi:TolB-like protein
LLYSFEDFSLDTARRELRRSGALIALQPQVFDLLEYAIRNRDRVVSKDDLLAAVWNGRIVSESTLSTRINAARNAIGDSGEEQRLLRTAHGKGIRFIGAVHEGESTAAPLLLPPDNPSIAVLPFQNLRGDPEQECFGEPILGYELRAPAAAPRRRGGRQPLVFGAGAAAVVVAGLVAWALYAGAGRELLGFGAPPKQGEVASLAALAPLAGRPVVAVLPFKNLSGDPGQDFFIDGITEDVITALGRFSNLLVVAKSANFQFKDRNLAPAEIGRQLDTRYLLEGSIRRAGDRVRVNSELAEAATGRRVWSEAYDAEVKDIFGVQQDIARRVVGAAAVTLTRSERGACPRQTHWGSRSLRTRPARPRVLLARDAQRQ